MEKKTSKNYGKFFGKVAGMLFAISMYIWTGLDVIQSNATAVGKLFAVGASVVIVFAAANELFKEVQKVSQHNKIRRAEQGK